MVLLIVAIGYFGDSFAGADCGWRNARTISQIPNASMGPDNIIPMVRPNGNSGKWESGCRKFSTNILDNAYPDKKTPMVAPGRLSSLK